MKPESKYVDGLNRNKYNPELGQKVRQRLIGLGLESSEDMPYFPVAAHEALKEGIYNGYKFLGLDVANNPSIKDTPTRFANMFVGELTKGLNYDFFPKCTATPNETKDDTMVLVKNIDIISLCEHHLQTIAGVTHVAYIPGENVLGLSKFARVAEFYARRPQIQERMTAQIYAALSFVLQTPNVAVIQDAAHYCMRARGVQQSNSTTITQKMGGLFMTNEALRKELFDAIKG